MEHNATEARDRLRGLEADASQMMADLSRLTAKLRDVGTDRAAELGRDAVEQISAQVDVLKKKPDLSKDSEKVLTAVDKSVRANPYVFILSALGLGFLLGKIRRS